MRRNPPLSEHMAEDDLGTIAHELAQRLYDDPSEGAEFVRDCLRVVASGLGDRRAEGEYEQKKEIGMHLHEAWRHLNEALAVMHPRSNPHMPRHPRPEGPRGGTSEAQSILVPADEFTPVQAKAWVKQHGFKVSGFEPASEERGARGIYHRFRQFDPDARHSYRTIPLGDSGVMAVIEVPKRRR